MSIIRNTGIIFGDQEVPIVSGKDLTELLPESHVSATCENETGERYTLRGRKNFGLFCVKRNDTSTGENNGL